MLIKLGKTPYPFPLTKSSDWQDVQNLNELDNLPRFIFSDNSNDKPCHSYAFNASHYQNYSIANAYFLQICNWISTEELNILVDGICFIIPDDEIAVLFELRWL